ncbi:MAG: putative dehydrogenase [Verrucomicrobiales bacterium]|jgi:predicted dehydrogenase
MNTKADATTPPTANLAENTELISPASSLTRRGFLRNSGAAGVGIGLIVTSKTAIGQIGTDSDDVRLGIIGCGAQAEALRAASSVVDGVKFGAVADIRKDAVGGMYGRLRASKKGFGADGTEIKRYLDPQQLIDEAKDLQLDGVLIACPDYYHHHWTRKALQAGLHVYCEKLMSNTIARSADMVKAQVETGKLCQIGHQRRSNPRYLHVRNKVVYDEKLLGWITHAYGQWNRSYSASQPRPIPKKKRQYLKDDILTQFGFKKGVEGMFELINWRMYKKYGGGIISDLGAHQIDIFNWFFQTEPFSVTATGGIDYYTEEYVSSLLQQWVADDEKEAADAGEDPTIDEEIRDTVRNIKIGYEHADNVMLFYEYLTKRSDWGTKAGTGDDLVSRAYYQVLTTTGSQNFYEKFMGEFGSIAISEDDKVNQVYAESHADKAQWDAATKGKDPLLTRELEKKDIKHKFWQNEYTPPPTKHLATITDARTSAAPAKYEIPVSLTEPGHAPHVRNFVEAVRKGDKATQADLNCPVEEAFRSTVSILKIFESLDTKARVELDPSDFDYKNAPELDPDDSVRDTPAPAPAPEPAPVPEGEAEAAPEPTPPAPEGATP